MWGGGQMNKINQRNEKPYKIFAIDSIYSDILPKSNDSHICFGVDIFKVLSLEIDLVFMSDVLHHLDNANNALKRICENPIKYIVIKDIDANYSFGDFMNKTHDLLINRQKVCSIFPQNLLSILGQNGFECQYFYLPKLFYPHFLIIAKNNKIKYKDKK